MRLILLAALLAGIAAAQDAQLTAVHATLVELRSQAPDPETMGASEKLTVAKHQLRDWIEGQLGTFKDEDIKPFAFRINGALKTVSAGGSDDDQNLAGSLAEVRFNEEGGLLIVVTGVGIICQDDESAYAYKKLKSGGDESGNRNRTTIARDSTILSSSTPFTSGRSLMPAMQTVHPS
jgi:hypothetical protein